MARLCFLLAKVENEGWPPVATEKVAAGLGTLMEMFDTRQLVTIAQAFYVILCGSPIRPCQTSS